MRSRAALVCCAVAAAAVAAGCGSSSTSSGGRLSVVATTTQLGDFARAVGGDDVKVTQILRPNTDPHDYEPRPSDVTETAGAKLVLLSGDNLDKWMGKVVDQSGSKARQIDVGATVPERRPGETTGPEASRFDPHWWHDPRNAEAAVETIRTALARERPKDADAFGRRADAYLAKLRSLDTKIRSCMSAVPAPQRKLVTDHDAFGYFAARYGVDVIGAVIPSQSTQAQPSARAVGRLAATIRREGVKAVFPESSVNPALARAIARQTGATSNLTLYGDTLGPKGSAGATYLSMEEANADAMVRGFTGGARGCTA